MTYEVVAVEIENEKYHSTNQKLASAIEGECNRLHKRGYEVVTVQLKPFPNQDEPNTAFVVAKSRD